MDQGYLEYMKANGATPEMIHQAEDDGMRASGMSDADIRDYRAYKQTEQIDPNQKPSIRGSDSPIGLSNVGKVAATATDYGSQAVRGTAAAGYQGATGDNLGVSFKDIALGKTPDTAELLRRGGTPEMDAFPNKPYVPSGRTLLGFAGDVVADPTTWVPALKGTKAVKYVGELWDKIPKNFATDLLEKAGRLSTSGVTDSMKSGGKAMYKSGLKDMDQATKMMGQAPVSDVLWDHGITGSAETIRQKSLQLAADLREKAKDMTSRAAKSRAEVDVVTATRDAQAYVDNLRSMNHPDPSVNAAIDTLQNQIDNIRAKAPVKASHIMAPGTPDSSYVPGGKKVAADAKGMTDIPGEGTVFYDPHPNAKSPELTEVVDPNAINLETSIKDGWTPVQGDRVVSLPVPNEQVYVPRTPGPSPEQMRAWKTMDQAGANYDTLAKTSMGQDFKKALAAGEKSAIEDSMRVLGPEAPQKLRMTNDELGRILTSRKAARLAAKSEGKKNAFTSVDGFLAGLGIVGAPLTGGTSAIPFALKKGADVSKTTAFRTKGGKALYNMGDKLPEGFWRQLMLQPTDRTGNNN